jgi:hypothetical protein
VKAFRKKYLYLSLSLSLSLWSITDSFFTLRERERIGRRQDADVIFKCEEHLQ